MSSAKEFKPNKNRPTTRQRVGGGNKCIVFHSIVREQYIKGVVLESCNVKLNIFHGKWRNHMRSCSIQSVNQKI